MFNEASDENTTFIEHRRALNDIVRLAGQYRMAPDKEKCSLLKEWGACIAYHLETELRGPSTLYALDHVEPEKLSKDVLNSIGCFFDAVQAQLMVLPWPYTPQGVPRHPGLLGLIAVLDVADKNIAGSPTLNKVLTDGMWNPERLLDVLQSTQQLQRESDPESANKWENLPFWRCTQMLAIATLTSEWVPPPNYGPKMWYVPLFHKFPDPDKALATLIAKVPHSLSAALEFYQSEPPEHLTPGMIERIFAMDFAKTNSTMAVQLLLELVYDHYLDDGYNEGMLFFQREHPDLFAAFQLQTSLFDSAKDAEEHTPACLPAWNHAIHGTAIEALPLPELGFESP